MGELSRLPTIRRQAISQLLPEIRDAVLGNAGTLITFRLVAHDATYMSKEFSPDFETTDIVNLPNYDIYIKLMIDGAPSKPFSATTILPQRANSVEVRNRCG